MASYVCILVAAVVAGLAYAEFERRDIWDNVDLGCGLGCLTVVSILTALGILCLAAYMQWGFWSYFFTMIGGFYSTLLISWFFEWLDSIGENHKGEDDDDSS
jgi:hypothetical protein